jgi:hypothetical protein
VGLFTGSLCETYIAGNVIDSNQVGLCSNSSASVVYGNSIVFNDSIGVFCSGSNLPILGDLSNADTTDDGYNDIWDNADFEVVNEATDTVQAENNYWGPYPSPYPSQFSGLVDYEPALEIVPTAVTDFTASLMKVPSDSGLVLQWSAVTTDVEGHPEQIDHYTIYRDTIPYFDASSGKILTQVPDTVLEYFDSGVVGDLSMNYYYLVRAVDHGSNESADSDQIGEFDRYIIERGGKSPDGWDMVSWPLIPFDTDIQAVFAESLGYGCQLTGGYPAAKSDKVLYKDLADTFYTAWYKEGGTVPSNIWCGDLSQVEAHKGYWVVLRTEHPSVILTMTGKVNTDTVYIPIAPGGEGAEKQTYVGTCWPLSRPLGGASGDDCGLVASGFTGGYPAVYSDKVRYHDGISWYAAWYKVGGPGPSNVWAGSAGPGGLCLEPGLGYIISVLQGHSFHDDLWVYPPPSSPGKGAVSRRTQPIKRRGGSRKVPWAQGSSTNQSLSPEKQAEVRKARE